MFERKCNQLYQDRADTECAVTILTTRVHVDDLYRSMICVEHAHYIVAMQDHTRTNKYNILYTTSGFSSIRGSLRLTPNYLIWSGLIAMCNHAHVILPHANATLKN